MNNCIVLYSEVILKRQTQHQVLYFVNHYYRGVIYSQENCVKLQG